MNRYIVQEDGVLVEYPEPPEGMVFPVQCNHCGGIYDLSKVEVTARYLDCSVWTTPCCNRPGVDDRPGGMWGGGGHYREIPDRGLTT